MSQSSVGWRSAHRTRRRLHHHRRPAAARQSALRRAPQSHERLVRHHLVSRLNHKLTGCIVIVMQRLHEDDLVGHVLDIERRMCEDLARRWKVESTVDVGKGTTLVVPSGCSGGSRIEASEARGGSPRLQSGEGGLSVRRRMPPFLKRALTAGLLPALAAKIKTQDPSTPALADGRVARTRRKPRRARHPQAASARENHYGTIRQSRFFPVNYIDHRVRRL